ncbi:MAG: RidA family protein [Erysipelotrichaceae bacterium]|nr:RidA family protein [Erysipelotrichaceae bacterium]
MFTKSFSSPNVYKAIGPYSPAVKLGDFVYVSGQLPLDVEGKLVEGDIQEQAYQVLKNMEAVLAEMNLEMRHIVKTTVFLTDLNDFGAFNEIYATYFSDPYPARSTVQVAALAKGAKIEIDAIVIDTLVYEQQMAHQHGESCGCGDECGCDGEEGCSCGEGKEGCDCKEGEECKCKEGEACDCNEGDTCTDGTCCG